MAQSLSSLGDSLAGLEGFSPFTIDAGPLQRAIDSLVTKVEECQKENSLLRRELEELKEGQNRIDALQADVKQLSDDISVTQEVVEGIEEQLKSGSQGKVHPCYHGHGHGVPAPGGEGQSSIAHVDGGADPDTGRAMASAGEAPASGAARVETSPNSAMVQGAELQAGVGLSCSPKSGPAAHVSGGSAAGVQASAENVPDTLDMPGQGDHAGATHASGAPQRCSTVVEPSSVCTVERGSAAGGPQQDVTARAAASVLPQGLSTDEVASQSMKVSPRMASSAATTSAALVADAALLASSAPSRGMHDALGQVPTVSGAQSAEPTANSNASIGSAQPQAARAFTAGDPSSASAFKANEARSAVGAGMPAATPLPRTANTQLRVDVPPESPTPLTPRSSTGPDTGRAATPLSPQVPSPMQSPSKAGLVQSRNRSRLAADSSWVLHEFELMRERVSLLEALLSRSQQDAQTSSSTLLEHQALLASMQADLQAAMEGTKVTEVRLSTMEQAANRALKDADDHTDRLVELNAELQARAEAHAELAKQMDGGMERLAESVNALQEELADKLTEAERRQAVADLRISDVTTRAGNLAHLLEDVNDASREMDQRLHGLRTHMTAVVTPINERLTDLATALKDLDARKLDAADAVTALDIGNGVQRAIDHADKRSDNVIRSIGALEERVEELHDVKANKCDVVLSSDIGVLLTSHAQELDAAIAAMRNSLQVNIDAKASLTNISELDSALGARVSCLEAAILKGLRTVSDKTSAALVEKLDYDSFADFRLAVQASLADMQDQLRSWAPPALGLKAQLDPSGEGASSCLCCDARVRSTLDAAILGMPNSPERLPLNKGLLPAITRSPDTSAATNHKAKLRKQEAMAQMLGADTEYGLTSSSAGNHPTADSTPASSLRVTDVTGNNGPASAAAPGSPGSVSRGLSSGVLPPRGVNGANVRNTKSNLAYHIPAGSAGGGNAWDPTSSGAVASPSQDLTLDASPKLRAVRPA
uniref:Uncharacterized protein n=1 Tax=Chlamydomonas euryale TaxID=1486919 RepID=A0A7R9YUQ3_9CHLO